MPITEVNLCSKISRSRCQPSRVVQLSLAVAPLRFENRENQKSKKFHEVCQYSCCVFKGEASGAVVENHFSVSEAGPFSFPPWHTLSLSHLCCVICSKNFAKFRLSGGISRGDFPPCSEKAPWVGFPCTEGSFAARRCTAAWNDFPSTRRGRLHHQPSGAWARRRMIGLTAWGAWRAGTAAGSLALLKCEFCATESSVFPQQLKRPAKTFYDQ